MSLESDPYYQLKVASIALLNGHITLGSEVIPVKNGYYSGPLNKYVLLGSASSTGISNKRLALSRIAVQYSIFCKGDNLIGNEIDDIGAQILAILLPYPGFKILSNEYFDVTNSELVTDISTYGSAGNTATKILERNIIIEHQVTHHKRSR